MTILKDLRLRFIGGAMGSSVGPTHVLSSRMDGRWGLSQSYFSRNLDKNKSSHKHYNISYRSEFSNVEDFLINTINDTDIYVILTPSPDHFDVMSKICRLNGNFLCEKSVVSDREQAGKLRNMLSQHPGLHLSVHNFSGYPMVREIKHLIQENAIGNIVHFDCEFLVDTFVQNPLGESMPSWRKIDGSIPALLLDLGPHVHHLSDFLISSKISTTHSRLRKLGNSVGIIDYADIYGDYDCGAIYSFRMSRAHAGNKVNIKIHVYGSKGSISWQHDRADELILYNKGQGHSKLTRENIRSSADQWSRGKTGNPTGHLESFANLYCDIADMAQHGMDCPYILSIESALQGIEFLADAADNTI